MASTVTVWVRLPAFSVVVVLLVRPAPASAAAFLQAVFYPIEMEEKKRLIDPIDKASDRHPCMQDDVHKVGGGEVLHVIDVLFGQLRLVPDVHPVKLVEG
jgi:hypothetical protein